MHTKLILLMLKRWEKEVIILEQKGFLKHFNSQYPGKYNYHVYRFDTKPYNLELSLPQHYPFRGPSFFINVGVPTYYKEIISSTNDLSEDILINITEYLSNERRALKEYLYNSTGGTHSAVLSGRYDELLYENWSPIQKMDEILTEVHEWLIEANFTKSLLPIIT